MAADIRPARATDVDALLAIETAVFQTDRLSRRSFRRLVASPSASVLVASVAGQVGGYCIVLFRAGSAAGRLYSIATSPAALGVGVGRALIEAAEKECRSRGHPVLRLEVREDNRRAIAIYEKAGFQRVGEERDYYEDGTTAVRMTKVVTGPRVSSRTSATSGEAAPLHRTTHRTPGRALS